MRPIVILGMQRSGTSAMSGALNRLGFNFGDRAMLYGADVNNAHGYFEHRRVTVLCLRCLDAFQMHPTSLGRLPVWWKEHPLADELLAEALALLQDTFLKQPSEKSWAIKHPLISMVLPLFLEAFEKLKLNPTFVVCLRNPLENMRSEASLDFQGTYRVMQSLGPRAIGSWLRYTLGSFSDLFGRDIVVVPYEKLLEKPGEYLKRILDFDPGRVVEEEEIVRAVEFIDSRMRRQTSSLADLDAYPNLVRRTFEAAGRFIGAREDWERINALNLEFEEYVSLFPEPPAPPAKLGLAWQDGTGQRIKELPYQPAGEWQSLRLEIDAPRKTLVVGLLYGRPARIWIRKCVWHFGERTFEAALKSGAASELFRTANGYRLDAVYEPRQVELTTPGADGPYSLEIELLLEQGAEISNEIAASLARRFEALLRSGLVR